MKLGFSTIGCPGWEWSEILAVAKDLGADGIEIRGVGNEIYGPNVREFSSSRVEATRDQLRHLGLEIPLLSSSALLSAAETEDCLDEAFDYIELAEKLGARYVRILLTSQPQPEEADLAVAAARMAKICEFAKKRGVTPLVETNGLFCNSATLAKFLEDVGSDDLGVLWDLHHTFRFGGEKPADTYCNIGARVRYMHLKDSVAEGDRVIYRMMGYGDVPIFDAVELLKEKGYDGYLTFEWVKRWNPDLQEPGIVFAHYMNYMRYLLAQ